MGRVKMPCKVCSTPFYPCVDCKDMLDDGVFFWRGVVCCDECARIYFRRAFKGLASNCSQEEEDEYDLEQELLEEERQSTTTISEKQEEPTESPVEEE